MVDPTPIKRDRLEGKCAEGKRLVDVAAVAGCSPALVSQVEHGYVPSLRMREQLAGALGASIGSYWE